MPKEYRFHEFAEIFPLIEGDDFERLVADIRSNGLREEIVLCDGLILDGRNRYRACLAASIEPRFREYTGDKSPWSLLRYSVSLNIHRRQMTSDQRAACAVRAKDLIEKLTGAANDRKSAAGGDKRSDAAKQAADGSLRQKVDGAIESSKADENAGKVTQQLAEAFDTNRQYVTELAKIQRESPETVDQIRNGSVRLSQVKQQAKQRTQVTARQEESEQVGKNAAPAAILSIRNSPLIVLSPAWYKPGGAAVHNEEVGEKGAWNLADRLDSTGAFVVFRTLGIEGAIDRAFHLRDRWKLSPLGWCIPVAGMNRFEDCATDILVVSTIGKPEIPAKLPKRADEVRCPAAGILSLIHSWFAEFLAAKGTANLAIEIGGQQKHKHFQLLSIEDLEADAA